MVEHEGSHWLEERTEMSSVIINENAYRSSGSQNGWVFDSRATSMSTRDRSIFEYMDPCQGNLTVVSGVRMPIKGRGIV